MGMSFSCQGIGAVFGSIVIMVLLLIFDEGERDCMGAGVNEDGHTEANLTIIWRVTYGLGCECVGECVRALSLIHN